MEFQDFAFRGIKRDIIQRQVEQSRKEETVEYEHSPIPVADDSVDRVNDPAGMRGDESRGK